VCQSPQTQLFAECGVWPARPAGLAPPDLRDIPGILSVLLLLTLGLRPDSLKVSFGDEHKLLPAQPHCL
jgi:hypothetical protein